MIINPYIYGVATSYDPDAQLFFNAQAAAGVTLTTTQMNAVNQWVVDSKAANIWTKFKAIYPIVGGTATSHKFNLKNPLDTNAAFRLVFNGGWTHSLTGMLPNGTNAYADTFYTPSVNGTLNSSHISFYSRTNTDAVSIDIGANNLLGGASGATMLYTRATNINYGVIDLYPVTVGDYIQAANTDSRGFYSLSRTASNLSKSYKNGNVLSSKTNTGNRSTKSIVLSALNKDSPDQVTQFSNRECAFASIGDGLTDLESQLFYQITEKYQVALSRNVNTTQSFYYNSAYNNETNAFLFSTQITDNTIQTATNTLVSDLKTVGVFTKMKALYPMVGGTATTHKFNLVNAQDSAAAFALSFVGGWTHSANGALPNGTNAYANTFLSSGTDLSLNSGHLSYYSRTNTVSASVKIDMGSLKSIPDSYTDLVLGSSNLTYFRFNNGAAYNSIPATNTLGFYTGSRTAVTTIKTYKNGAIIINGTAVSSSTSSIPFFIGASNFNGTALYFSNNQCAFASIGDGLSDAEALAYYNAVQLFNTTLARQV